MQRVNGTSDHLHRCCNHGLTVIFGGAMILLSLLTTDLFKRQAENVRLSRAQALQAAMLNLLDSGVFVDPDTNKPVFAYAHPIFWAPFTLVGNGMDSFLDD